MPKQSHKGLTSLYSDWLDTARDSQLTPSGDWAVWLILAGRRWGKTRTGGTDAALYALKNPNVRVAVVVFLPLVILKGLRLVGKAEFYLICPEVAFFREGGRDTIAVHKKSDFLMARSFKVFRQRARTIAWASVSSCLVRRNRCVGISRSFRSVDVWAASW